MVRIFLSHKTGSFFEGQEDKVDFVLRTFSGSRASFSRRSCQRAKIPWRTAARKNLKGTLKKDCRINNRKSHTEVRLYTRKNKLLNMVDDEDV